MPVAFCFFFVFSSIARGRSAFLCALVLAFVLLGDEKRILLPSLIEKGTLFGHARFVSDSCSARRLPPFPTSGSLSPWSHGRSAYEEDQDGGSACRGGRRVFGAAAVGDEACQPSSLKLAGRGRRSVAAARLVLSARNSAEAKAIPAPESTCGSRFGAGLECREPRSSRRSE